MDSLLAQAFVFLAAAVLAVPLAQRMGLGSVLGYLIAGVVIGPAALGLVGSESGMNDVMHVAEFGVVLMLFLVGLELQPMRLWGMRGRLFGLGGLQVVLTAAAITGLGHALGFGVRLPLAVGVILAMSSTAIVLQSLQEKGLMRTPAGESAFAVLLFQDIAVIPIFALLPLLTLPDGSSLAAAETDHGATANLIAHLPGWAQAVILLAVVGGVIMGGRFVLPRLFRAIAGTRLREMFTATALMLVVGIALAMQSVGLSPALGTFLAGVVLANSEYRHELESDIEPFKGLLLGLFFISVGAGIDFHLIVTSPGLIAGLVAGLLGLKFIVLFVLGRVFRLDTAGGLLFAFALAQGGEFAFVLLSFAQQQHVLSPAETAPLIAAVALSMAATPLLFILNERLLQPRFAKTPPNARPQDMIESSENPVILAGFGRFGHIIGRVLRGNGFGATVLDHDSEQVDVLRALGLSVFYGDALRPELLHSAGAQHARLFVIAIDDRERSLQLVAIVQQHFPHLTIMARALDRAHEHELGAAGVKYVYRETLGTSLDLSEAAMRLLGMRAYQARRQVQRFRRHDEIATRELAAARDDDEAYMSIARQHIENLDRLLRADLSDEEKAQRHDGWEPMPPDDVSRD